MNINNQKKETMRTNTNPQLKFFVTQRIENGITINNYYLSSNVYGHVGSKQFANKAAIQVALADLEIEDSIWPWADLQLRPLPLSIPKTETVKSVIAFRWLDIQPLFAGSSDYARICIVKDRTLPQSNIIAFPSFAGLYTQLNEVLTKLGY